MIAFVVLVPVATEKVSLYLGKCYLESVEEYSEARSIRVNLNLGEYLARNLKADVNLLVLLNL